MPRKHRFAPPGYNLHITQRGNYGQRTFFTSHDHRFFLNLVAEHSLDDSVDVLAYCLMPNHFHLILHGHQTGSISRFMQSLNGRYAQFIHSRLQRQGRFWQSRFYSCVLDSAHLVAALRYVELNPVRANMVPCAPDYPWSSALIHTGQQPPPSWLNISAFGELFTPTEWQQFLADGQPSEEQALIRRATRHAAVAGSPEFIGSLEVAFSRNLQVHSPGRPRRKQAAAG